MKRTFAFLLCSAAVALAAPALADEPGHEGHGHGEPSGHAAPAAEHHADEHGAHAGGDHHVPTFDQINWFYGVLGERDGVEPSFIYRPKGMPAPFGAYLANAAILYFILYRFLKKPVTEGLKSRKNTILRGMDEAARMQKDAEKRLADYEHKLEHVDEEIERVRREMREAGESERTRILAEARSQRERMERDARVLVEQELAATKEALARETIAAALRSAVAEVERRLTPEDHQRLAEDYLANLQKAGVTLRTRV